MKKLIVCILVGLVAVCNAGASSSLDGIAEFLFLRHGELSFDKLAAHGIAARFARNLVGAILKDKDREAEVRRNPDIVPLDKEKHAKFYASLETMCKFFSLEAPAVLHNPNWFGRGAFTTGLWSNPVIVLSKGLVETLSEDELAAVVGHELAHIKHRDSIRGAAEWSLAIVLPYILHLVRWHFLSDTPLLRQSQPVEHNDRTGLKDVAAFLGIELVFRTFVSLLFAHFDRYCESRADREAALSINDPAATISALKKVYGSDSFVWWERIWINHPSLQTRIKQLEKLLPPAQPQARSDQPAASPKPQPEGASV